MKKRTVNSGQRTVAVSQTSARDALPPAYSPQPTARSCLMKISLHWLREWVETGDDVPALAHALTMAGLEIEGVESRGTCRCRASSSAK